MTVVKDPGNRERMEERLTALVEAYQEPVRRMCVLWLRDASLAEDAAQETFLKAYPALPSFRGGCSEKTWLMRIAVNVCRNMLRNGWFRHVDRRTALESLPEPAVPFSARDDTVVRLISELPQKEREVLLLYFYQDMSMREIAETLHIAVSNVSRRLNAAKEALRGRIEREWKYDG